MGRVGNNQASTIKCSCPVDFDRVEYDTPRQDWVLELDSASGIMLDEMTAYNPCDPTIFGDSCSDVELQSSESTTVKVQHNWGNIIKAGVSYSATASAEFLGMGAKQTFTVSFEYSHTWGGFHEEDQTLSSTKTCIAKPMTSVTCQYVAYKGHIEVGYTIYWKNASPTRGTYKGEGWKMHLSTDTQKINSAQPEH